MRDYEDELYLAKPPLAVQRILLSPIAWLARRRGYRASLPYADCAPAPEAAALAA